MPRIKGYEPVESWQIAKGSRLDCRRGLHRPALDTMLNVTSRRKFDVAMAWAIDCVGQHAP